MDDRIAKEWRREEPHGSVYRADYKTSSGVEKRWYAQFRARDYTGKVVTYRDTRSTTKKGAQRALFELKARALAAKNAPTGPDLEPQTLGAYLDQWHGLRVDSDTIRHTTATNESRHVKLVKSLLGDLPLRSVSHEDVDRMLAHLRANRLKGKHRAIQQVYRMLRKALADVRPRLAANPCDGVDRPQAPKPETRSFSPTELRDVLEAADRPLPGDTVVDETFSALVHFLAHTGLRIGEALALTWADVDFDGQLVHVRRSLSHKAGEGLVRTAPKTATAVRAVPLEPVVIERLRQVRGKDGTVPHKSLPVFPGDRGGPQRMSNVLRRRWHPLLKSLGLEQCGFHRLRHSFASLVLRSGMDIGTVSKMLGHASIAITTDTYAHAIPGREREAARAIAAVVAGRS
jgi:integrase